MKRDRGGTWWFSWVAYDRGDLYPLQQPLAPKDSAHASLILERQPEESFIDQLVLYKVTHAPTTEIAVAADLSRFYALARSDIRPPSSCRTHPGGSCLEPISRPDTTEDAVLLKAGESVEVTFPSTAPLKAPKVVVRARYRPETLRPLTTPTPTSSPLWAPLAPRLLMWLDRLIPSAYGCDVSVRLFYQNLWGQWKSIGVMHPRSFYTTEVFELPPDAVRTFNRKRQAALRLLWTQVHSVSFVGIVDGESEIVDVERLQPTRAYHHRLQADLADQLRRQDHAYLHTIQGDIVEVAFDAGKPAAEGQTVSYVMGSEGFYTNLRQYLYPEARREPTDPFWTLPQGVNDPLAHLLDQPPSE